MDYFDKHLFEQLDKKKTVRVVIAGGGTGGHIFPGIAIAQAFIDLNSQNEVLFIGAGKPIEKNILSKTDFIYKTISVKALKGTGILSKIRSLFKIPGAVYQSIKIYLNFKPDIVIGVGGYVSGPALLAAKTIGIRTAIQEQNSIPGFTNRVLAKIVKRIFISFLETTKYFNPKKTLFTGNPIRKSIANYQQEIKNKNDFTVLITGGSQGAQKINNCVIEALEILKDFKNLKFIHQTGELDYIHVLDSYSKYGIDAEVKKFFNNMDEKFSIADLIICRAGATTISEITAMGKASILIPFPFAADNHQEVNANTLASKNAADTILQKDLNKEILAEKIKFYMENTTHLEKMQKNAKNMAMPQAANHIVLETYNLIA